MIRSVHLDMAEFTIDDFGHYALEFFHGASFKSFGSQHALEKAWLLHQPGSSSKPPPKKSRKEKPGGDRTKPR